MAEEIKQEVVDAVEETIRIIRHYVNHPEDVEVNMSRGTYRINAELHTHPRDVGQVVGSNAYLISSLRSFLAAIAGKHRIKINLDYITEEENSRKLSRR